MKRQQRGDNIIPIFASLILAVCLTQFAADIYAPSLPAIASGLNGSINQAQWSMSIYMLGVALSQLIYGPLSEGIGRKLPLVIGLVIMLLGSLLCVFAHNIEALILGRFIQGCGAGACASLWRSIFRDIFTGEDLAKYGSYLVIFIMFIVPSAPLLGGYLQDIFAWYASFVFMLIYTLLALAGIVFAFRETNTHYHISHLRPTYIVSRYRTLLSSRLFIGVTCSTFISYGAFFVWFVLGPILLIDKLHMSATTFGWLTFLGGGSAYVLAGYLNGKLVKCFGMRNMLRFGWAMMLIAGVIMLATYFLFTLSVWSVMLPVILFYFGSTFIWPNAFATAFTPFGKIAGYAGASYGFMQIFGAAVISGLVAYLPHDNQLAFAMIMILSSICAWLIYEWAIWKEE